MSVLSRNEHPLSAVDTQKSLLALLSFLQLQKQGHDKLFGFDLFSAVVGV